MTVGVSWKESISSDIEIMNISARKGVPICASILYDCISVT